MTNSEGPGSTQQETLAVPARYAWLPLNSQGGPTEQSLRDLIGRVTRRRWMLLSISITIFALVTVYAFVATPRYRSEARLRIDTQSQGPAGLSALADQASSSIPGGGLLSLGRDELETEIGVLRSDRVADAMIDSLALGVRVTKPSASRAAVLSARVVDPQADADGRLTLSRRSDGRYDVERKKLEDVGPLPTVMAPGTSVQVGGTVVTLSSKLTAGGPSSIVVKFLPRYEIHKLLERRLTIARQDGGSRLVEVAFEDPDRTLAVQVVNDIVGEYVNYSTRTDRTQDTVTVDRLRMQVDTTGRRLSLAETALRSFEEHSRLIAPQEQAAASVKRISAVSARVDAISTERNALAQMLAIIGQRSGRGADASAYRQLATFPSLITNRAIQDLLQSLVELENKRSELGARRTESNVEYKQFTDRINEIERQLYTLGPQYLESLDQQLAMTVRTVSALSDTMNMMPGAVMQYTRLVRDRTVLESTYVALLKQLKAAELRDVLRQEKIRVVDAPRIANLDDPSFPKKGVMALLGAVLGITFAFVVVLLAELWRAPTVIDGAGG